MMKDSIFTPGPWTQHNTTWEDGDGNTIMPIISDSPDMVGQRLVALVRDRKDNGLTNATLIANAPAMLDALEWLKKCTDSYYGAKTPDERDWYKPDLDHAFSRCWQAIEQARGTWDGKGEILGEVE
jgi:hypothetical protein